MPYEFHGNSQQYFQMLADNTRKSTIPFIKNYFEKLGIGIGGLKVLELGCGEGGNLLPFVEMGAYCVGVDLEASKIEGGKVFMSSFIESGNLDLRNENIYDKKFENEFFGKFDLVILKDVIEHVPDKVAIVGQIAKYLNPQGVLFVGWPPWRMPFGGHQQIASSKILRKLPWIHLLPRPIYKFTLKYIFREKQNMVDELIEIHDFSVSISDSIRITDKSDMQLLKRWFYFINPIYEFKFGFKTRKVPTLLAKVPYFRDFVTTSCYILLKPRDNSSK